MLPQEAGASEEEVVAAIAANPWMLGLCVSSHARPTLQLLTHYGFAGPAPGSKAAAPAQQGQQQQHWGQQPAAALSGDDEQQAARAGRLLAARPALMLLSQDRHLHPLFEVRVCGCWDFLVPSRTSPGCACAAPCLRLPTLRLAMASPPTAPQHPSFLACCCCC